VLAEQRDAFTGDVVVPGHGAVGGPKLFDRQIDVLRGVIEKVTAVLGEGGSRDEARAAALTAVGALLHAGERVDAYVNLIWTKETNL
jgi:hypothetical protein